MTDTVTVDVSVLFKALTTPEEQKLVADINQKLEVAGLVLLPVGNLGMAEKPKRRGRKAGKRRGRKGKRRGRKAKAVEAVEKPKRRKRKMKRGGRKAKAKVVAEKPKRVIRRKVKRGGRKAKAAAAAAAGPLPRGRAPIAPQGDVPPGTE